MKKVGFLVVLYLSVFAVYWQVKGHEFILVDDHIHITENPHFHPLSWQSVANFWCKPYEGLYIPVTYTLWAGIAKLNYVFFGYPTLKPATFHLLNLFLHAANTWLVFAVLLFFVPTMAAFFGALFFGVHLAQVEVVAWVSGFKDLSSTFFSLLCLWAFFRYATTERRALYWIATGCYVAAILSKPSAIAIVPVLFCIEVGLNHRPWLAIARRLTPWALMSLPVVLITQASQSQQTMKFVTPVWQRFFVAADAVLFYLGKTLVPLFSAPDYSRTPERVVSAPWGYVAWMAVLLVFLLIRQKDRKWTWLLTTFILSLSPVLGLIPFSYQFFSTVADRYLYFPLFVVAIAVAFLVQESSKRQRMLLGFLLMALAFESAQQAKIWKTNQQLFTHLTRINPKSLLGTNNLGTLYENADDLDGAELYYRRALSINPAAYPAMYNLGRVLARKGYYPEALALLLKLVKSAPQIADAQFSIGLIYLKSNRLDLASEYFLNAAMADPQMVKAHYHLGTALLGRGQFGLAEQAFDNTLKLSPLHLGAEFGLAECAIAKKDYAKARQHLATIRSVEPRNEKVRVRLAQIDKLR